MRRILLSSAMFLGLLTGIAVAGDAEVKAAQEVISSQLKAFQSDDGATAYSYAAPNVKMIFPTLDSFMSMVTNGYPPVHMPKNFAFGKVEETGTRIAQQVMIVGPDGKDYEALYTLEAQPDGRWLITGVSLRASNSLST